MKKILKRSLLIMAIMSTVSVSLSAQNKKVDKLLKNPQTKEEIFSAIMNNKNMKNDLMKRMMADSGSNRMMNMMQTVKKDTSTNMMSTMMMGNPQMMNMMMNDNMCGKMCSMMMNSDKMKDMMKGQMHENQKITPKKRK